MASFLWGVIGRAGVCCRGVALRGVYSSRKGPIQALLTTHEWGASVTHEWGTNIPFTLGALFVIVAREFPKGKGEG